MIGPNDTAETVGLENQDIITAVRINERGGHAALPISAPRTSTHGATYAALIPHCRFEDVEDIITAVRINE